MPSDHVHTIWLVRALYRRDHVADDRRIRYPSHWLLCVPGHLHRRVRALACGRGERAHLCRDPVTRSSDAANGVRLARKRVARTERRQLLDRRVDALRIDFFEDRA